MFFGGAPFWPEPAGKLRSIRENRSREQHQSAEAYVLSKLPTFAVHAPLQLGRPAARTRLTWRTFSKALEGRLVWAFAHSLDAGTQTLVFSPSRISSKAARQEESTFPLRMNTEELLQPRVHLSTSPNSWLVVPFSSPGQSTSAFQHSCTWMQKTLQQLQVVAFVAGRTPLALTSQRTSLTSNISGSCVRRSELSNT